MKEFVAGVDGGGTKTLLLCQDLEGKELLKKQFGPFNYNSIGQEGLRSLLSEITDAINKIGKCLCLCIGAAGASNPDMVQIVDKVLKANGLENYILTGDHIIALQGAHEGGPGLAVIAGTGSICFGKDASGRVERTGGWGHIIGDQGSAYSLGRDLFCQCAKAMDGYGEPTILTDLLAREMGLSTRNQIIKFVYSGDKASVASVAPLVDEAYFKGDKVACKIIEKNARALAQAACGVASKLKLEHAEVALLGALLEKETPLKAEFEKILSSLAPGLVCIKPRHGAAVGAVMLALEKTKREKILGFRS